METSERADGGRKSGTRQRILDTALALFSRQGFSAVSVRDIAAEVGVRESAMYKHFAGKQAVFEQLVENYMRISDAFMAGIHALPSDDPAVLARSAEIYRRLSDEDFLRLGGSVFTDFLMRPDVLRFWRMISIERFHDKALAEMWNRHLFEEPISFQTGMFGMLMHIGALTPADPAVLALDFYTPLLALYLNALPFEPDGPEFVRSLELAGRHMAHFREIYGIRQKD